MKRLMNEISDQLRSMREQYDRKPLRRADLDACPLAQFANWLQDAVEAEVYDPNACSLSTVDLELRPLSRAVLLKGIEDGEFVFFTNFNSRKARNLAVNPNACMHFPWFSLQRQVTVLGEVAKVAEEDAEEYFQSRPYQSRLGAWASDQSEELESREVLENEFLRFREKFGEEPPKPPHWGGFRLCPQSIEFWQGGPNRLHDRFLYEREKKGWSLRRLNP